MYMNVSTAIGGTLQHNNLTATLAKLALAQASGGSVGIMSLSRSEDEWLTSGTEGQEDCK